MNTKEVSVSKRHERRVSRLAEDFVIEMLHITKEFPGIKANDDITCSCAKARYMPCWARTAPAKVR